jgi:hypothetical protein
MPMRSTLALIAEDAASALRTMARHRPTPIVIETNLLAQEGRDPIAEVMTE